MLDQTFDRLQKLVSQLELLEEKLLQEDVNQKLLRSLSPEWNIHAVVWMNKADLDTMSMDNLYNNLKVYEPEVNGMSSSSSSTQNMAFVSSSNNNTSSTNGAVNTAHGVSTASTQLNVAYSTNIDNLSDDVICTFFASQQNSPQLVHEVLQQMAMLTMRATRFLKNTRRKLTVNDNETIGFDKSKVDDLGGYDWIISSEKEPKVVRLYDDAPRIEEWVSDDEKDDVSQPKIEKKTGIPQIDLQDQGVIDSGCSRHMIRNMSYLTDYEEIDGGYVAFGRNPKGEKITRKCTIKTGKFDSKADEGFFVGYSLNSKAFRVFNSKTRIVEENLHIMFSESTPNVVGSVSDWLFDIDALTRTINYEQIVVGTQSIGFADLESSHDDGSKFASDDGKKVDEDPRKESECKDQEKEDNVNNTNNVNTAGNVNTVSLTINVVGTNNVNLVGGKLSIELPFDQKMHALEDDSIFDFLSDDEDDGVVVDMNNLDTTIQVSPILTTRIHKDYLLDQVIEDLQSGYTQEERIDYDDIFTPVARIKAIRIFLAYASFKDFVVYQMDVNSAFLYGKIKEEVYACQPPRFEDLDFPDRVYKVEKALYGLHQAPRTWYETLSTYLLDNGFQRGKIDKTLFFKSHKGDILLVQVYVADIIFGSIKKELCIAFERLMHEKFHMSSMGELTFFLGLQVKQKKDGIFISQDKYVAKILKKFRFTKVNTASTSMETQKPLLKDEDGKEVDVHMYRNLFPPLDNPELTIRRRSRSDPTLLNNSEMAAEGNGDLPFPDLRTMEELCQPSLNGRGGPIALIAIQATNFGLKNDIIQQMAKMFLGKYFPPSMVTKLRNEITNFRQRPDESLFEAWERYKLSIDRCPNHNMFPITQIDTFYNGLTLRQRDTINAAAGGTFMKRRPEECYDLIENMTTHHNDWDTSAQRSESSSSITSSFDTEIAALKVKMAKINKNLMRVLQVNQQVKAVTPNCETCGGPHSFSDCPATIGNTQNVYAAGAYQGNSYQPQGSCNLLSYRSDNYLGPPAYQAPVYQTPVHQPQIPQPQVVTTNEFTNFIMANNAILKNMQTNITSLTNSNLEPKNMFGHFMKMNTTSSLGSGTLPGNTITNPKEDLKGITTRSETAYQGPTIPTTSSSPVVERDTGKFLIPCDFPGMAECLALDDLGANINLMSLSVWNKLSLPDLSPTYMTLEFVDRSISRPVGVAEDVFVKVGKLILHVRKEAITFNLDQTSRYSANYNDMTANRINVIDRACEEYSQEVLDFFDVIASGNPTPYYDPIVSTTSPTLTPFGNSDFFLEEVDAFLALEDDPTSPEVDQSYVDTEGDILLLEAFLNDDPSLPSPNQGNYLPEVHKELKICEAKTEKSLIDEPSEVELKDLPPPLEYVCWDLALRDNIDGITICYHSIIHKG
nr:retrovirus-related Pol polyprotein from transposon TNT 1-94 [Tanacetum cinerariifolium]